MKIYKRLLTYSAKYKYRLAFGIILSFLVSIFNGVSLTSMIPIFDSLGKNTNYNFQLAITNKDKKVLKNYRNNKVTSPIEKIEYYIANYKIKINKKFSKMDPPDTVWFFITLVFPIYLMKLICLSGAIYFINTSGHYAIRDLRLELYKKLQVSPLDLFVKEKTGILMSRVINDVEVLSKIISSDLKDTITDFFYIVTHLSLLLIISWKMFLVMIIVVPVIMLPISTFTERIRKATRRQQDRLSSLNGHLQEVIAGIRVIRAFSMEKKESDRFKNINQDLADKTFKGHFYHQVGPAIIEFSGSLLAALFLAFGAYLISQESLSRGMFMAFFMTLIFLMRPLKQMGIMINLIQTSRSAGERVFEIVDMEVDIKNPEHPKEFSRVQNEIQLKDVSYRYPGSTKDILKNITISIPKGETVAIVGESGSGKSTLVDLLPRFIDPSSGAILFDGVDIRNYNVQDIRRDIAIVSQNVFLFNETIKYNIAYGNHHLSDETIIQAAKEAYAWDFITEFENGIETIVGERGVMLSGGQRQRLSIARALLLKPDILILDEATSALDTESERLIQHTIDQLNKHTTIIIIAHRLSTIQIAKTIFLMENGEVLEQGTHSELLALNGKYKNLYELQYVAKK